MRNNDLPNFVSHPYMPNSVPEIRDEMLRTLGASKLEDLVTMIPDELRFKGKLELPVEIESEFELKKHIEELLSQNISCQDYISFLGGGCYQHYVPAVCDEINNRAEFLTAYVGDTYSDHGKFQAFFEYSSLMAELLEMDVVSYPTFDGGQAVCSSLRMSTSITDRNRLLLPSTMNPEILSQIRNYCGFNTEIVLVKNNPITGQFDLSDLESKLSNNTAAVFFENPSYLGFMEENGEEIGRLAHAKGALCVVSADPISLGIFEAPVNYGADIVCGDIQPLGIHMHYGGGCAGYIASRGEEKFITHYPTYLYGITNCKDGKNFGWGRALNWRTSHGSREKANEYMGTAAGLWAITAAVYLSLMGPQGMKEIGETIIYRTNYAKQLLSNIKGIEISFPQSTYFKEFTVNYDQVNFSADEINQYLLNYGIFGGKNVSNDFSFLGQASLYCITEMTSAADIRKLVKALGLIISGRKE
jgi:glycine dehydrogenase subunit 1